MNKTSNTNQIISLPQGDGALHGIGETFSPDLHTGTGNFTVPIALPPGRNGFQPQLNLVYSTGNGNGPFGLGPRASRYRSAFVYGLVTLMATVVLLQVGVARGAPGDIFSIPAPAIGSDPPKASDITDGDASVSTQTGALQYSYPIRVPPGRNGLVPHLALSYSSQAPIYGVIAAGWSLS